MENKGRKLSQFTELEEAKFILYHELSYEIFMSILHPAASLFRDVTGENSIKKTWKI